MSSNISIDEYCKNPQLYKDKLDDQSIKYMNTICDASKSEDKATPVLNTIESLLEGLTSPKGLEILSAFVGFSMTKDFVKKCIQNSIKTCLEQNIKDFATLGLSKYPTALLNNTIISKSCLDSVIQETGYLEGTRYLGLSVAKAASLGLDFIMNIANLVMLFGMILDLWDPCKFNTQKMGAEALKTFSDLWDKVAYEGFKKVHSIQRSDGQFVYQSYGTDYNEFGISSNTQQTYTFIMENLLPDQKDFYDNKNVEYQMIYLTNLKTNSDGFPLYWPPDQDPLTLSDINSISNKIDNFLSNNNTVVTNWFYKFLPIIIACIIFLFFIFFLIKYG